MAIEAISIMGVKVSRGGCPESMAAIGRALDGLAGPLFVTTPNPEIILAAQDDEEYFSVLNRADIALPDGIGLFFAGLAMGQRLNRQTGTDAAAYLLEHCGRNRKKVLIINWRQALQTTADLEAGLAKRYPGAMFKIQESDRGEDPDISAAADFGPDLALCTLGAPWQEKALIKLRDAGVGRVLVACGGALDLILGKVRRAPWPMRALGLEWLWRVIVQGNGQRMKRLKRIINAVVVFPAKFIRWRFILPWLYRPNVACLVYKKEEDGYKILLVERSDQPGHWQLPQGGLDGQPVGEGGRREASQELNTDKLAARQAFGFLYRYEFPKEGLPQYHFTGLRHYGYRGQKQALAIIEFLGQDSDIRVNSYEHLGWKWVVPEELVDSVHERRREATKIYLDKFKTYINDQVSSINDQ